MGGSPLIALRAQLGVSLLRPGAVQALGGAEEAAHRPGRRPGRVGGRQHDVAVHQADLQCVVGVQASRADDFRWQGDLAVFAQADDGGMGEASHGGPLASGGLWAF